MQRCSAAVRKLHDSMVAGREKIWQKRRILDLEKGGFELTAYTVFAGAPLGAQVVGSIIFVLFAFVQLGVRCWARIYYCPRGTRVFALGVLRIMLSGYSRICPRSILCVAKVFAVCRV